MPVEREAGRLPQALRRFGAPVPPAFPAGTSNWRAVRAPIDTLSNRAAGAAFVEYPTFEDGIIRSVPMLIQSGEHVYGQMGLVLACRILDTPLEKVRVESRHVVIPRAVPD